MDSEIAVIGFASNGTEHPDAFVLVNLGEARKVAVKVLGLGCSSFGLFRTADDLDRYEPVGQAALENGTILYDAPEQSATTFFAQ